MPPELELAENDPRWVLIKARLEPVGQHYLSQLLVRRGDDGQGVASLPVSLHRDGRIDELVRVPDGAVHLKWEPPAAASIESARVTIRPVGWIERVCRMRYRVALGWFEAPWHLKSRMGLTLWRAVVDLQGAYRLATRFEGYYPWSEYADWAARFDRLEAQDLRQVEDHIRAFPARPRFQVLIATHGATGDATAATLASLKAQLYREFDHALVGEGNAIAPRPGEWIILMRAGETLAPHALYWFACAILENPAATIVYSDDDAVHAQGQKYDPRFKPDWSPAHLRSTHYIGSAAALRGDVVAAAGGISPEDCRHGNYDLLLRVSALPDATIVHVPAVLYHRQTPATSYKLQATSFKPQATSHQPLATSHPDWESPEWCMGKLRAHLDRIGSPGEVVPTLPGCWRVRYRLPESPPLISIIIPTRNAVALLRQCVESVLRKTTYPRFEILIIDNQSDDPETLSYFREAAANPTVRVLRYGHPFNYSAINNFGAREARGEALCLLNNDTEIISPDWLEEMASQLLQAGVGAVGARLLYPDGRVQHGGVTVGPGGCADHLHGHVAHDEPGYCNRAALTQELSAVTAACMLTWKRIYEDIGGLNEKDLPVAFNDVDYCLRLQEAGYRIVYTAGAELFHHESATRGREETRAKRSRANREMNYLKSRWADRLKHDPYYNPNFNYKQPDFSLALAPRVRKPWRKG